MVSSRLKSRLKPVANPNVEKSFCRESRDKMIVILSGFHAWSSIAS